LASSIVRNGRGPWAFSASTAPLTAWLESRSQTSTWRPSTTTAISRRPMATTWAPGPAWMKLVSQSAATAAPETWLPWASRSEAASTASQAPRSDQAKSTGSTAARPVFSITA
jgi:hypothetical protein